MPRSFSRMAARTLEEADDRRASPRHAITLRVDYKRMNTFFADYTRNISKGGTFIRTERPLDVTTEAKSDRNKIDLEGDLYRSSLLRKELAEHVTDPRNRFFSRAIVNRVWAELLGRGFVNPVDDFKADNPPSHPKTLDYLAD